MVSNRPIAVESIGTHDVRVTRLSGSNNVTLYRSTDSGVIRVTHEGSVQRIPTGNYAICTNSGVVYNSRGEAFFGTSGGGGTGTTVAQTITVPIEELRNTIYALPRHLSGNVTVNVLEGIAISNIDFQGFFGVGVLTVQAVDVNGIPLADISSTHNINSITIIGCNNARIIIQGFNCTTTANAAKVFVSTSSASIRFEHMNIETGNASLTSTFGISAIDSPVINVLNCNISNQFNAIRSANNSQIFISGINTGTNNNVGLFTTNGTIMINSSLNIQLSATTLYSESGGGKIWDTSGGSMRVNPLGDNTISAGTPITRFTQLFSTNATINTSDENEKTDITPLPDDIVNLFMSLDPVSFKRIDDESGETHFGLVAQDVEKAIAEYHRQPIQPISLNDTSSPNIFENFAGVVCSPITELVDTGEVQEIKTPIKRMVQVPLVKPLPATSASLDDEIISDETLPQFEMIEIDDFEIIEEPIMEERVIGNRYGLRYSEFHMLTMKVVQMQQKTIGTLEDRIATLEQLLLQK